MLRMHVFESLSLYNSPFIFFFFKKKIWFRQRAIDLFDISIVDHLIHHLGLALSSSEPVGCPLPHCLSFLLYLKRSSSWKSISRWPIIRWKLLTMHFQGRHGWLFWLPWPLLASLHVSSRASNAALVRKMLVTSGPWEWHHTGSHGWDIVYRLRGIWRVAWEKLG